MGGDLKSLEWLLEQIDKNAESENAPEYYAGIPGNLLGSAFVDIYRDILARGHRFYNFKGGRGSLKSSFCALVLIDELMRNKNFCAIALRQVKDTLRASVYAQIKWAADMLGIAHSWICSTSLKGRSALSPEFGLNTRSRVVTASSRVTMR